MEKLKNFARARTLWLFVFCFLFPGLVRGESGDDLFRQGNAAYAKGQFDAAASLYQRAADQGLAHWILYYDLGNAYYKTGSLGKAIASYERAFRLHSTDRDLIYNLNLTSTKAGDPVLPQASLAALCWRLFYAFSLNTLTVLSALVWLALFGVLAWALWFLRPPPAELSAALALGLLFFSGWLGVRIYLNEQPEGVVSAALAEVRSGPSLSYPANFTIPEGHHVLILDEEEPVTGWLEVGVPDQGLKGWVPDSSIDKL